MRKVLLMAAICILTVLSANAFESTTLLRRNLAGNEAAQSPEVSGRPASNAFDGSTVNGAGWGDGNLTGLNLSDGKVWIWVDLGENAAVDAIRIDYPNANGADAKSFDIEFYDVKPGAEVQPVYTETATMEQNAAFFEYTLKETQKHRYMRLKFTEARNIGWGIQVQEISVYTDGSDATNGSLVTKDGNGTVLLKGVKTPLKARIFKDGVLLGETEENIVLNSTAGDAVTLDGMSVTSTEGQEFNVTFTWNGNEMGSTPFSVIDLAELKKNCVAGGKAEVIDIIPSDNIGGSFASLVNENEGDGENGWNADAFNGKTVPYAKGDVQFTIDLKGIYDIQAISYKNTGAGGKQFVIEVLDGNKNTILSIPYTTKEDTEVKDIVLPRTASGTRYVRFNVIDPGAYGMKLSEVHVYGTKAVVEVASVELGGAVNVLNGETAYVKVATKDAEGNVIDENADATFTVTPEDVVKIGEKTADGYPVKGVKAGEVKITAEAGGKTSEEMTFTVSKAISDMECEIYSYGLWKAKVVEIVPSETDQDIEKMVDSLDGENEAGGGWGDNGLLEYTTNKDQDGVANGQWTVEGAYFTIDLGRDINVSALRLMHSGASVAEADLLFLDKNKEEVSKYNLVTSELGRHTDDVYLPKTLSGVRYLKVVPKRINVKGWGARFIEIHVYGPDNEKFKYDGIDLFPHSITFNNNFDYKVLGYKVIDGKRVYDQDALNSATVKLPESEDVVKWTDNNKTKITGLKKGVVEVGLDWTNSHTGNRFTPTVTLEVATDNWEQFVNIAKRYKSVAESNPRDNGFTQGNPSAKAYAINSVGGMNESVQGLIDGDWMAWTIKADEIEAGNADVTKKPAVVIDLGTALPIDEFNICWNANANVQAGENQWKMMYGDYTVYATAAAPAAGEKYPADGEWTEIHSVQHAGQEYDVDRHIFEEGEYRFVKFVFNGSHDGMDVSMNEIRIGGSKFGTKTGTGDEAVIELTDYPASHVLKVVTPRFDRSNTADREADNDWIVTSKGVKRENKLRLSAQAVDCYGRTWSQTGLKLEVKHSDGTSSELVLDNSESEELRTYRDVVWDTYFYESPGIGEEEVVATATDGGVVRTSEPLKIITIAETHNINRFANAYDNAQPMNPNWDAVGSKEGKIRVKDDGTEEYYRTHRYPVIGENGEQEVDKEGNPVYQYVDETVYGDEGFENYAYGEVDKPYNYAKPTGQRDIKALGGEPGNAADGNFGSWYAVCYYGDIESMGDTYQYPAGYVFEKPIELTMDYREIAGSEKTSRYAMELDMLGIQYEGAFPRDYEVEILQCEGRYLYNEDGSLKRDEEGNPKQNPNEGRILTNADGSEAWTKIATFTNMQSMGVGQTETQRVYNADEEGNPVLYTEADWNENFVDVSGNAVTKEEFKNNYVGKIKPWTNVAAVRVRYLKIGTQWGIKMMESAMYGTLNKTVLPLFISQKRYGAAAGTEEDRNDVNGAYVSFDLEVNNRYDEANFTSSDLAMFEKHLPEIEKYEIELRALKQNPNYNPSSDKAEDHQLWVTESMNEVSGVSYLNGEEVAEVEDLKLDAENGKLSFTVPADKIVYHYNSTTGAKAEARAAEDGETAYGMVPVLTIKDADPSRKYTAYAVPFKADNSKHADIELDESRMVEPVIPAMTFTPGELKLRKAEADVDIALDNVMMDDRHNGDDYTNEAKTYDGNFDYKRANIASMDGTFSGLKVVNRVLQNWNVEVKTTVAVGDAPRVVYTAEYDYDTNLKKEDGGVYPANEEHNATMDYVQLPTTLAEIQHDQVETLNGKVVKVADAGVPVMSNVEVTYTMGESKKAAVKNDKDATTTVSTDELTESLLPTVKVKTAEARHLGNDFSTPWYAVLYLELSDMPEFNGAVGGKGTTTNDYNWDPAEGIMKSGGWEAYNTGIASMRFENIAKTDGVDDEKKVDLHALLTFEYPVLLAPVDEDGNVGVNGGSKMNVTIGGKTFETTPAVRERAAGQPNMQSVAVEHPLTETVTLSRIVTGVDNLDADGGAYTIYTVDGLVAGHGEDGLKEAVETLPAGVYVIRHGGKSTRFVKK